MPLAPFAALDGPAIARSLAQIAERSEDLAEAYFECLEEVELPVEPGLPGLRVRCEEGLAVRLLRGDRSWLASRDEIHTESLANAMRQVTRVRPSAAYAEPQIQLDRHDEPVSAPEVLQFPSTLGRVVREHHVAFPYQLRVRRHRRWLQVVGTQFVPAAETESYYSVAAQLPWGSYGTLLTSLDDAAAGRVANELVDRFRWREAESPVPGRGPVVLAPAVTAVLLHEAVAHALEADTLSQSGRPEAAIGLQLGSSELNVLDDPLAAPETVRRTTDDEGMTVLRRWLVRAGVVEQPLADLAAARSSPLLVPGAGRRADRHSWPGPRSTCVEMLGGDSSLDTLLEAAAGGLYVSAVDGGRLDVRSGSFVLCIPFARRIVGGEADKAVGPFELCATVAELLGSIGGIGDTVEEGGAGWCAKGGARLPVWARTPAVGLENIDVIHG